MLDADRNSKRTSNVQFTTRRHNQPVHYHQVPSTSSLPPGTIHQFTTTGHHQPVHYQSATRHQQPVHYHQAPSTSMLPPGTIPQFTTTGHHQPVHYHQEPVCYHQAPSPSSLSPGTIHFFRRKFHSCLQSLVHKLELACQDCMEEDSTSSRCSDRELLEVVVALDSCWRGTEHSGHSTLAKL